MMLACLVHALEQAESQIVVHVVSLGLSNIFINYSMK